MKKCTKCLEDKPRSEFYKESKVKSGLQSQCKSCVLDKSKRHYLENKDRIAEKNRARRLGNKDKYATRQRDYKYKMSSEQYQKLLEEQNHACAICGKVNASGQDLYVDHDHSCCFGSKSCGKCIRGLLCSKCNMALGLFDDSIESLNKAVEYRKKYSRKEKQ